MATYQPTYFTGLPQNRVLEKSKDHPPYVFTDAIAIAVDVALATDRPLLLSGKPGSGKSRLAEAVAALQGWNYLAKTMTSRSRLEELTVEIDHLRRLNDANTAQRGDQPKPEQAYYKPGILWWAFNPQTARFRNMSPKEAEDHKIEPLDFIGKKRSRKTYNHSVLLIDEIDKAEPDLPNDLLEPLDCRQFSLPDGKKIDGIEGLKILTIITTNGERTLPQAFLRRCITLELPEPEEVELVNIASKHFPEGDYDRMQKIAAKMIPLRQEAEQLNRRSPGTSEFLDAVNACEELRIEVNDSQDSVWRHIESAVLKKERDL